jgi:hypothetical protein
MFYMKNRFTLIAIASFINFAVFAQNKELDSIYKVPVNPFWTFIMSIDSLQGRIMTSFPYNSIPTQNGFYKNNVQEILKKGNMVYIHIAQTGIVFKLDKTEDSLLVFKRIDKTYNINYNIDGNTFLFKDELYCFGGYGFWKSNGHLRKFNFVDKEWDIVPLNKEIYSSGFNWLSEKEGRIYLPFEREMNAGVKEQVKGIKRNNAYYLDLETNNWVPLGILSDALIDITKDDFINGAAVPTSEGYLYVQHDQVYLFDFLHNQVLKSNNSNLNQFLARRMSNIFLFNYKDNIYSYDPITSKFVILKYDRSEFELKTYPIWTADIHLIWYIVFAVLCILFIIGIILYIRKRVKHKIQSAQLKMLKTKTMQQAFIGTELTLIELLLAANLNQQTVEIHQINHVLGIKDKNVGLQKKVRSDVMNAINDKYQFISQSNMPLISSVRKEDDKRFFEYFITLSEIKKIQRIIQE